MRTWALITGEYPPAKGGVADYTFLVARDLAAGGDEVHVFAPGTADPPPTLAGVTVHPLPDHYGGKALRYMSRTFRQLPSNTIKVVQYVPHGFGCKGMNLRFAWWVYRHRPVFTMFHEIIFAAVPGQPLRHRLLALATHHMARLVIRASRHYFYSTPSWREEAEKRGAIGIPSTWTPVPSNIATDAAHEQVTDLRRKHLREPGELLVGHFGTYGNLISAMLRPLLTQVLTRQPAARILLLGQGSERFLAQFQAESPTLAQRMTAAGALPSTELAVHLKACDLVLQPYPDGACCRRGSLMAGMALGCPIVTTANQRTEPIWQESEAVVLVPDADVAAMADAAVALLEDPARRQELASRAKALYETRFAVNVTVQALRAAAESAP